MSVSFIVSTVIIAMYSYTFKSRKYPHLRSLKAIKIKDQQIYINIGVNYTEAFKLICCVNKL